jgi:Domain of unknown function (DUF4192)
MPISLRNAADVVAMAAPLLGYAPTDSVIAYMLRTEPDGATVVRFVFRLPLLATTDQAGGLARTLNLNTADNHGAILLAICDPADDAHVGALLDALRNSLHGAGIPVTRRLLTRTVTVASYWIDVDTGDSGPTYPYTDSELAATAVSEGQRIARSRAELAEEFSPIDPAPLRGIGNLSRLLADTVDEITQILAGQRTPSPDLSTRASLIIRDRARRDRMLRLAIGHERAASQLWTHIARQLRGRARAEALTVAAVCYTLHNDTMRAIVALEIVTDVARAAGASLPALAELLEELIQSGIDPQRLRDIIAELPTDPPSPA